MSVNVHQLHPSTTSSTPSMKCAASAAQNGPSCIGSRGFDVMFHSV